MSSLSNNDMAVAERIGNIIMPEPTKKQPSEAAPAPQTTPTQDTTPDAVSEAETEIELADDSGADYSDDLGTEDAGHGNDDVEEAPVAPPSGLRADEIEAFNALSPAAQKAWVRRDQDRTKELNRVQSRLDQLAKERETEKQTLEAERQRLAQAALQFGDREVLEFQRKFADVTDPAKLASEEPLRFLEFQGALQKIQMANAAKQQLMQQQMQEQQHQLQQYRDAENLKIREKLNLKDDASFQKFDTEISHFLLKEGYNEENVVNLGARELAIAYDAMRWRRAQANRKQAETKTKTAPSVVRPGVKSETDQGAQEMAALRQRLKKSGSVDDAAALFSKFL